MLIFGIRIAYKFNMKVVEIIGVLIGIIYELTFFLLKTLSILFFASSSRIKSLFKSIQNLRQSSASEREIPPDPS